MVGQERPALVTHKGKINDDKRVEPQRASGVHSFRHPFLSGAFLACDHDGEFRLRHLLDHGLHGPHAVGRIIKAVVKAVFHIVLIEILDPVFAGGKGNLIGGNIKSGVIPAAKGDGMAVDGVKGAVYIFKGAAHAGG